MLVLDFTNISGSADAEWLSSGIAESESAIAREVITARSRRSIWKSRVSLAVCDASWSSSTPPTAPGPMMPSEIVCGER